MSNETLSVKHSLYLRGGGDYIEDIRGDDNIESNGASSAYISLSG